MPTTRPGLLLLHALALAGGAVAGMLGSFVHPLGVAGLPAGLLLALALSVTVVRCAGLLVVSRSGAAAAGVGWLVMVLLLAAPRPEGDLVVAGNSAGYAWLVAGTLIVGLAIGLPHGRSRRAPSARVEVGR